MTRYAERTKVPASQSRAEIEKTLARYGATGFGYGWADNRAMVTFQAEGRHIRFVLEMPTGDSVKDRQALRQRWRALLLVIKAKLEAVESGITEFDDEFMAHIVLPDGKTVGEFMKPQIIDAYDTGNMPPLLTWSGGPRQ